MKLFRRLGLRRRYGHFSMKSVEEGTRGIKQLAKENPAITAAVVGASGGAIAAGLGVGSAAVLGGVVGVAVEEVTGK